MKRKILICGSGNGGHVLAAILGSRPELETRVLSLFCNKSDLWTNKLQEEPLTLVYTEDDGREVEIKSRPDLVSNNPAQVVPGADVILITVPAFAHQTYLTAIEPYITSPILLVGLPGQPGFEFQSRFILEKKLPLITILSSESLPWSCRIVEYGRKVRILGSKKTLRIAKFGNVGKDIPNPLDMLQLLLGPGITLVRTEHHLELSLIFFLLNPGLIYGKFKDWDGKPVKDKPLLYHGADDCQVNVVEHMDEEVMGIGKALAEQNRDIRLGGCKSVLSSLVEMYNHTIDDKTNLKTALLTNKAYTGLTHPMKSLKEGFNPDFYHRFLSEDVPYGLVVVKGLAVLAGVKTPSIDRVIQWTQEKLGKVYIVGSELKGGNLNETRAPQVYGITSLNELNSFLALT